jgi:uncharacterized protein with PQ loop repeat
MTLAMVLGISIITVGLALQTVGSGLLLGGYAPQIIKLHRTKIPTGISLLFWTMIAIGCSAITVNMIIQDTSIEIIITQALNGFFAWYTLFLVMYCRKVQGESIEVNPFIIIVAITIVGFGYFNFKDAPIEQIGYAFQTVGTVALLTAYLPQIWYLYQVKDATGISRWLFIVLGSGLLLVTVNMIITGASIEIIITEFVNIALIMVQYGMTVYYQNKKK